MDCCSTLRMPIRTRKNTHIQTYAHMHEHTHIHILLCKNLNQSMNPGAFVCTHCTTLHYTALHCNTLQHTATHCNTLQHTVRSCCWVKMRYKECICIKNPHISHHTVPHCTTLQHTATHCNTSKGCIWIKDPCVSTVFWARSAEPKSCVLCKECRQCYAVYCSALQCVAVCCSVLQHVAACCSVCCSSVLQCIERSVCIDCVLSEERCPRELQ